MEQSLSVVLLMGGSAVAGIYNAFNFSGPIILGKIVSFLQSSDAYQKSRDVQTLVSTTWTAMTAL